MVTITNPENSGAEIRGYRTTGSTQDVELLPGGTLQLSERDAREMLERYPWLQSDVTGQNVQEKNMFEGRTSTAEEQEDAMKGQNGQGEGDSTQDEPELNEDGTIKSDEEVNPAQLAGGDDAETEPPTVVQPKKPAAKKK